MEYFNPRPREEGDQSALDGGLCLWISIHALVKRATRAAQKNYHGVNISIHALVKRATDEHLDTKAFDAISIHALVKRATETTFKIHPKK